MGRPSQSQEPAAQDGPLDWALIPPRPRNAFWSICLFTLGHGESPSEMGYLAAATTERGTPGWRLVVPGLSYHDKSIGEKTIIALVRLGLIEPALDEPHCLVVSTRGAQTWWLFHARGGRYPEDLTDV